MATATRISAKELRQQAQALGIEGWDEMGRRELTAAVKEASDESPAPPKAKRKPAAKRAARPSKKRTPKPAAKEEAPVEEAKPAKGKAKKAEATYTEPPKGVEIPEERENPFRKGSNIHSIFPLLAPRGGKRRTLAERLRKKVDLHPYSADADEIDLLDYDKRIVLAAQTLRDKHGYAVERKGRGLDGTIKVFIPGGDDDPRSK